MDIRQKLFPRGNVHKDFREWFYNDLIKVEVSSVEEHYYLMLLFNSKFKYISASSLNTNIVYLNLKCLMQTYLKSQDSLKKNSKKQIEKSKNTWR